MALSLNLHSVEKVNKVIHQVGQVILGKDEEVREVMTAFLADGHILLEDIPGVGKTTLALAFSKSLQLDYKRVQFTPDVLPSDLTGFSIYRRDEERFVYRKGSVFCNLLLADEINRTSPKTQSALLEVMEEREVTVDGITRRVGRPFLVIATQNPAGSAGTQMLPEAQMDRFTVSMTLGYPDFESELTMIQAVGKDRPVMALEPVIGREELLQAQESIHQVYMKDSVSRYLLELVTATRNHPCIERGASPRASIALVKMSKAWAWLDGRDYVTPGDVYIQFPFVISHRIRLTSSAVMGRQTKEEIIKELLSQVSLPSMGLR